MDLTLTPEQRAENRRNFDDVCDKLRAQNNIISSIKKEIEMLKGRFTTMCTFLISAPDRLSQMHKDLYDTHCYSFLHSINLYLTTRDSSGQLLINPVDDDVKSTPVYLKINFPNQVINKIIVDVDNITIDLQEWDLYINNISINALKSSELVTQFSVIAETPDPYLSKKEFSAGVASQIEKIYAFASQICYCEQKINCALRYVSDLKQMNLY